MRMKAINSIIKKSVSGKRIADDEGLTLFRKADLLTLGELANGVRRRFHPERLVTFVVDRNINYTNICINKCRFCAFYRDADSLDAYVLSKEEIFKKIEETLDLKGKIAVRVPNHPCVLALLEKCRLLVGTSANFSGQPPFGDSKEIARKFSGYDALLDGGQITDSCESTIVEVVDNELKIVREGKIKLESLV